MDKLDTIIEKIDKIKPDLDKVALKRAANILKNDGLVAFPTETVYGLGANALSENAVKKIFIAKGRPSDNPLIVHISKIKDIDYLAKDIPQNALKLIERFWPGALTLVFKKNKSVPYSISGGLDTVAIRMPCNKIALSLIDTCGFPIAAPSANISGKPSSTEYNHVFNDLYGKIDMILDGGNCDLGLESTVVEVFEDRAVILRPGSITEEMLKEVITNVEVDKAILLQNFKDLPKAPGMKYKHYAPKGKITIIDGNMENTVKKILFFLEEDKNNNVKSLVISTYETAQFYKGENIFKIGGKTDEKEIARNLFSILRKCDDDNIEKIYIESFRESGIGFAIMNRLKKASGYNIVKV